MNLLTLSILCAVGALSRMSYYQALKVTKDIGLQIAENETATTKDIQKNLIGMFFGTLLLLFSLIYGFVYFRQWLAILYLICSAIASLVILNITRSLLGGELSRLILIWVLPILGCIYFLIKTT